ncbi:olfactory receptor 5I1-like [Hyperolius riggenbachi]|uniref:olfactory receptor 5I1-like n=1 Tax=Hyperolius riggenbachi TaxID=752182 RepID=UPI0035A2F6F4
MEMKDYPSFFSSNHSNIPEFILSSISSIYEVQLLLFMTITTVYVITIFGNVLIILVIQVDTRLHTSMYFFLTNLSFMDVFYASVTIPKLLDILVNDNRSIPFYGCILQMYFFHVLASSEMFLLAGMAYDRYVAICNPLRYSILMRRAVTLPLGACAWLGGFTHSTFHTAFLLQLHFCGPNKMDNFFCDATPLIKLSCSDTTIDDILLITTPGILGPSCFMLTLGSYGYIVRNILNIKSKEGRYKTFSTCASHLIVVSVFYGTATIVYIQPTSVYSSANQFITIFYAVITPMLNPIIYTLRNKEVKGAMQRLFLQQRKNIVTVF